MPIPDAPTNVSPEPTRPASLQPQPGQKSTNSSPISTTSTLSYRVHEQKPNTTQYDVIYEQQQKRLRRKDNEPQQQQQQQQEQYQQQLEQPTKSIIVNTTDVPAAPRTERPFCVEDDDQLTVPQLMMAGGLAGITEHIAMFPVDTVKTRMQSYVAIRDLSHASMLNTTRTIVASEGLPALWRGVSAVALSAGPAHALYFATYELVTEFLTSKKTNLNTKSKDNNNSHHKTNSTTTNVNNEVNPVITSVAGGCATIVCDGVMTPLDVVKQRMQLSSNNQYTNIYQCARQVYSNYGIRAFFAGYKATLLMNIPFTAMYFTGYEVAKSTLLDWKRVDETHFSASSHCIAGAFAGATAATITNPLDVVKTRLQTQGEVGARRYRGLADALRSIRVEEGVPGLFRGVRARVLFHMPAAAVCWTTYEFCKHAMRQIGIDNHSKNRAD